MTSIALDNFPTIPQAQTGMVTSEGKSSDMVGIPVPSLPENWLSLMEERDGINLFSMPFPGEPLYFDVTIVSSIT